MQFLLTYPEGKTKALTFSYDDGKLADRRLVALFNQHQLKGTFHINGGLFGQDPERIPAAEIADLYQGHEVAAHTLTHPTIERCPLDQVALEVLEDRRILEGLVGYPVTGLSYPNGSYTEAIKTLLPSLGIDYSRVVGSSEHFGLPQDWYQWQATCHHSNRLLELGQEFVDLDKPQYLYLMYVWGHSYEFERDQNWDLIEGFAQMVAGRNDIWYCTNQEFYRYLTAAKQIRFNLDGTSAYHGGGQNVWYRLGEQLLEIKPGFNQFN